MLDEGCPTDATTATFFINSLGETFGQRGDLCPGSIDLRQLAESHGLDWEAVCHYDRDDSKEDAKAWYDLIDREFAAMRSRHLNPQEAAFADRLYALMDRVDHGRFRVYGEIRPDGEEHIVLVTEFADFCDNDATWGAIRDVKERTGAHLWIMREEGHLDRHHPRLNEDDRETDEPIRGREDGATWFEGPDHGRMERQVELSWRIDHMTPEELDEFVDEMEKATETIWGSTGVGVL